MSFLVPLYYLTIVGLCLFGFGLYKKKSFFIGLGCCCFMLMYLLLISFGIWESEYVNMGRRNNYNRNCKLYWGGYEKGMNDTYKELEPKSPSPKSLTDPLWQGLFVKEKGGFVQAPMIYYEICMERGNKCPFCGVENLCPNVHQSCPNCGRLWPPPEKYFRENFNKEEYLEMYDGALSR